MHIHVSGSLARFTDYNRDIEVEEESMADVLETLCEMYPDLEDILYDRDGNFRSHHHLYLNGEPVEEVVDQPVGDEDRLDILTAIAGG